MGYLSELKLPLLGETMESGRITEWCIEPGDDFERGQILLEVETDKTIVEVPALQQGKLVEIVAEAGTQVTVGAAIAQIELAGEAPVAVAEAATTMAAATTLSSSGAASVQPVSSAPDVSASAVAAHTAPRAQNPRQHNHHGQRLFITPRARRTAKQYGLDEQTVVGTGRRHRITHADVIKTIAARSKQQSVVDLSTDVVETPTGEIHRTHWIPRAAETTTTVVFIHGLFGDAQVWVDVASLVVNSQSGDSDKSVAACALDLPAHGNSQSVASTHDQVYEAVLHAVQDFDRVVLVGHSYGGAIAASVALQLKEKVASLLLVAPVGLGSDIDQHFLDTMSNPISDETLLGEVLARLTASGKPPPADFIRVLSQRLTLNSSQLQAMVQDFTHNGTQKRDIQKVLQALECPLTIVWGRDDRIINWRHSLNAPEHSNLTLLANTGHMPQLEKPRQLAGLLDLLI